ncbi:hypothetical protein F2P81_006621 [Scophthalmus maximus]|uniref:Uncharacterized protein n=1 Tax=Scophthalmus maximus TaxID=52904 RepID=A0A6A4T3P0_SCOMX|nr:hypothetical protein F2P81_006621 [Scophthalmus maximus]
MAESSDIPLLVQYLLENIIMAGCILGTGSFITWDDAMGNQWVYEYQGSRLILAGRHLITPLMEQSEDRQASSSSSIIPLGDGRVISSERRTVIV